jgi:hypothetical protein
MVTRRMALTGAGAYVALLLSRRHEYRFIATAEAQALEGVSLGLQAYQAFSGSSQGIAAYLSAIKQLTEENIALTRKVLVELNDLSNQVDALPDKFRDALREKGEQDLRAGTEAIVGDLAFVQQRLLQQPAEASLPGVVAERLKLITTKAAVLSGARATPYGRGPVAAYCVPIIMGAVAKAYAMQNDVASIKPDITSNYLPWLAEILNPNSEGSLPDRGQLAQAELRRFADSVGQRSGNPVFRRSAHALADSLAIRTRGDPATIGYIATYRPGDPEVVCDRFYTSQNGERKCARAHNVPIYRPSSVVPIGIHVNDMAGVLQPKTVFLQSDIVSIRTFGGAPQDFNTNSPREDAAARGWELASSNNGKIVVASVTDLVPQLNKEVTMPIIAQRNAIDTYSKLAEGVTRNINIAKSVFGI